METPGGTRPFFPPRSKLDCWHLVTSTLVQPSVVSVCPFAAAAEQTQAFHSGGGVGGVKGKTGLAIG